MTSDPPPASASPFGSGDHEDRLLPDGTRLGDALSLGRRQAWAPWFIGLGVIVVGLVWAGMTLPTLPDQMPTGFGPSGEVRGWEDTSFGTAATSLIIGAGATLLLGLIAAMVPMFDSTDPAKRSLWGHFQAEGSHRALRAVLGWITLLLNLMFVYLTAQSWSYAREAADGTGADMPMWPVLLFLVGIFVAMVPPFRRWARWSRRTAVEHGIHPTPQEEAEEKRWLPGGILNDPTEPKLFVPKREGYGVGLTLNVGHPKGKAVVVVFLLVILLPLALMLLVTEA
ncbi:hypothetical protein M3D92_11595 [Micrococcus terreus]|uniref:hypothetical protein n=1 Tax=Micrococcus terreus TaxID=574650 RepID=UPI0021A5266B|nr:hypothetical protein [Micrococcus terreus]MCT2089925.1 hypothetical protein [Micrococcus terreus]MDK7702100.1 hypothetical protein [Micrococcus terreus]WOO97242.1 hypothetical protein R3I42_12195 [Micrococcus terreus]